MTLLNDLKLDLAELDLICICERRPATGLEHGPKYTGCVVEIQIPVTE